MEDAPSERLQSRKKKAHQGVTKVGRAKVVVASHDEDSHAGSKYDYERGCNFLKEELYGSRLKRVPGNMKLVKCLCNTVRMLISNFVKGMLSSEDQYNIRKMFLDPIF